MEAVKNLKRSLEGEVEEDFDKADIKTYPSKRCMFNVQSAQQMFSQRLPGARGLVRCL